MLAMEGAVREAEPSPWVTRFAALIRPAGKVLDLAAGHGRHSRWLRARGFLVSAVDRDVSVLARLQGPGLHVRELDLERAWPLAGERFDAVVVTNYLHRPFLGALLDLVLPDGVLLYETFMVGQERMGRPRNPDFLLQPAELLEVVKARLQLVAFEQGKVDSPQPRIVQRVCAVGPLRQLWNCRLDTG